jgi:tripartite ATP-independent transporter DctM subunit
VFIFAGGRARDRHVPGGLGLLEIKAMKEDGYPASFAGALTCASCIIGPLVPPSIPMVLYGVIANASVGALFLAGIVPGLLTAVVLMIHVYFYARKRNFPKHPRANLRQLFKAFMDASLALFTPVIIMGGIFGGIFTPTEAAAVAAIYSLFLGLFVYGDLKFGDLPRVFKEAVNTSAVVGFIVAGASLFSWVLARERVPQQIAEAFLGLSTNPHVILLIINLVMLLLGCFMEGIAIMILMVPVFLPVILQLGIDPVHFGVIVTMNLMIGILTPPFGVALFTVAKVGNIPFEVLARAIVPFLPPLLIVLVIITHVPQSFMWLPRWFLG